MLLWLKLSFNYLREALVKLKIILAIILFFCTKIICIDIKPLKIGNLAVRAAFQPGPLFAKGQKMLDKNQVVFYEVPIYTKGKNKYAYQTFIHNILYGISDRLSILVSPSNARYINTENNKLICSKGFLDLPVTVEYDYYVNFKETSISRLSIIGSVFFPTGARYRKPTLGFGSFSFFAGLTARYLSIDWYIFADVIAWPRTEHCNTKYGSSIMYDWGIGRNIKHVKDWVFLALWEFNGLYSFKDLVCKKIQHNTGGNIIFCGPSIWISSNYLKLQAGIQWPMFEHLFGVQNKITFRAGLYITIAIN